MIENTDASRRSPLDGPMTDSQHETTEATYTPPRLRKIGQLVESTGLPVTEFTLPNTPVR